MTLIPQAFYAPYLRQSTLWPSISRGEDVSIDGMHPAQAINSYHRLLAGMDDRSAPINRGVYSSPLAMALLEQAVGEAVIYVADVETPEVYAPPLEFSTEECFDILSAIDRLSEDMHPIKRAYALQRMLTAIQNGARG